MSERDILSAAEGLAAADDARLKLLCEHDPDMIRDVARSLAILAAACQPLADKATNWEKTHPGGMLGPRRDSVQIEHRVGDFRRIRHVLKEWM